MEDGPVMDDVKNAPLKNDSFPVPLEMTKG